MGDIGIKAACWYVSNARPIYAVPVTVNPFSILREFDKWFAFEVCKSDGISYMFFSNRPNVVQNVGQIGQNIGQT